MSKRYGRNRRRQHREQIALLEAETQRLQSLNLQGHKELATAKGQIAEIAEIIERVAQYSVALPPKRLEGGGKRNSLQLELRRIFFERFDARNATPDCLRRTVSYVDVYALRAFVERHQEAFQRAVHLRYYAYGDSARHGAYMVSESALRSMPFDVLVKHVAIEISHHLRG